MCRCLCVCVCKLLQSLQSQFILILSPSDFLSILFPGFESLLLFRACILAFSLLSSSFSLPLFSLSSSLCLQRSNILSHIQDALLTLWRRWRSARAPHCSNPLKTTLQTSGRSPGTLKPTFVLSPVSTFFTFQFEPIGFHTNIKKII